MKERFPDTPNAWMGREIRPLAVRLRFSREWLSGGFADHGKFCNQVPSLPLNSIKVLYTRCYTICHLIEAGGQFTHFITRCSGSTNVIPAGPECPDSLRPKPYGSLYRYGAFLCV